MKKGKQHQLFLPVLESQDELKIPWETLRTIIGGKSIIDTHEIHTTSEKRSLAFLRAYGIDPNVAGDASSLTMIRDFAFDYLDEVIFSDDDQAHLPDDIRERSILQLLQDAANWDNDKGVNWPCAILKVCHATAHALWSHDSEAHEQAIEVIEERLKPFLSESHGTKWIGDPACMIPLIAFDLKREKHLFRVITKLLHKPGNISTAIRDHIGLRFIVEDTFSAILLIKFLRTRGVFMYANNIPEEAKNSLADLTEIEQLYKEYGPPPFRSPKDSEEEAKTHKKRNRFSSSDFGMIKLIERLLITLPSGRRTFFPYELQILTRSKWENIDTGDTDHAVYEARQVASVRSRLLRS